MFTSFCVPVSGGKMIQFEFSKETKQKGRRDWIFTGTRGVGMRPVSSLDLYVSSPPAVCLTKTIVFGLLFSFCPYHPTKLLPVG
jgi:hypothetical protein